MRERTDHEALGGDDTIRSRAGNDTLTGGTGNDTVSGDGGDDTYAFNLGDGQDVVKEYSGNGSYGGFDTIQFGSGITSGNLVASQGTGGVDLILSISGTTDKITIQSGISGGSDYRVEQVRFADGTLLSHAQLLALSTTPTAGNDLFYGDEQANVINGGAGADTLYGRAGNDTLTGGTGNDMVSGDGGDDTYAFNLGDGQDVVKEYSGNGSYGGFDTLQFGAGITSTNLVASQGTGGVDLILSIAGTTDKITIQSGISGGSDYRVEQVRFSDATLLSHAQLLALSTTPTAGNDLFYGDEQANAISGGAGDDTIRSRAGNDTLTGGTGADTVSGDGGDDTYAFNLGDGQDVVKEYSGNGSYGGFDTIQFGAGITSGNLVASQGTGGVDLILSIAGTTDKITIQNGISGGSDYRVEQVRFFDGTLLSHAQLLALSATATVGADTFYGDEQANAINGGDGADAIDGRAGNDTITGGAGADILTGGSGSDRFVYTLLSDSLYSGYDRIMDFQSSDVFGIGHTVSAANFTTFSHAEHANGLLTDFAATLTTSNFVANGASLITLTSGADAGAYVLINDAVAGFQASNDAVVKVQSGAVITAANFAA